MDVLSSFQIVKDWYLTIKNEGFQYVKSYIPETNLDIFDFLVIYTIVLYVVVQFYIKFLRRHPNEPTSLVRRLYLKACGSFYSIPPVARYINSQTGKLLIEIDKDINKTTSKKTFKIPDNGMTQDKIQERLQEWTQRDGLLAETGKISGSLYIGHDKKYESGVQEFTKNFIYHNILHFDTWPAVRQMEAEVIRMTADMFGQEKEGIGALTAGGSESLILSILAHRNWARDTKGITEPNVVLPETAHVAIIKACQYFCIDARSAPVNPKTFAADLGEMKKLIDSNTIMLFGSAPSFPHGIIDPIEEIAALAQKRNIGCHVDACLGGFIIAFQKENLPKFDFSVPGVTSISCDHHKYGCAPKGSSVILYKTKKLRSYSFFAHSTWSGGVYMSPTLAGSRGSTGISGAWYAMVCIGKKKYTELSVAITDTVHNICKEINQMADLEIMGKPNTCVVGIQAKSKSFNIYAIHQIISKKGWNLSTVQNPHGLHLTVTHQNCTNWKQMVIDIKDAVAEYKANPSLYKGGTAGAIYGTTQSISSNGLVNDTLRQVLDYVLKV